MSKLGTWVRPLDDAPVNDTGLEPVGRAILVEPFEPEREASMRTIIIPESVLRSERVMDVKVRCVAVGPQAWKATAVGGLDEPPRCQPGDVIYVARMSGFITTGPKDGKMYRLVNDRDVFAKVTWFGEVQP
jgi:co-chaperonin GroES (HSP10)